MWRNTNDPLDLSVYKHKRTTYTFTGGSYYDDYLYTSGLKINGSGTCDFPTYTTTYISGHAYGTLISTVNLFDDPVDPATVMTAAEDNVVWGDWTDESFGVRTAANKAAVFAALDSGNYSALFTSAIKSGPSDPGGSSWYITAQFTKAQVKVRLDFPLAVKVIFETGTTPAGGGATTWAEDAPVILHLDHQTETLDVSPGASDETKTKRVKRLIYIPYA